MPLMIHFLAQMSWSLFANILQQYLHFISKSPLLNVSIRLLINNINIDIKISKITNR